LLSDLQGAMQNCTRSQGDGTADHTQGNWSLHHVGGHTLRALARYGTSVTTKITERELESAQKQLVLGTRPRDFGVNGINCLEAVRK
jgi:hypothetical protein